MSDDAVLSACGILANLAHAARLAYARDLDLAALRGAIMEAYDAAQAHLAELEVPHE